MNYPNAIIAHLERLTLSGGDLDGQPMTVWSWERRFIRGAFRWLRVDGKSGERSVWEERKFS